MMRTKQHQQFQKMELLDRLVVIGGAPKAATTSLANMLHLNPRISVSQPKEPCYFGKDLSISRKRLGLLSREDYLRCFNLPSRDRVIACVDSTTLYYASRYAVDEICTSCKQAKFIFIIRDPVEVLCSWHSYLQTTNGVISRDVDIPFIVSENFMIPTSKRIGVRDELLFDFRRVVALGTQALELLNKVDSTRILFVDYRLLIRSTRDQYLRILKFIGVEDDGQCLLPRDNVAHEYRSTLVREVLKSGVVRRLATNAKRRLPDELVARIRKTKDTIATRPISAEQQPALIEMLSSTDFLKHQRMLIKTILSNEINLR